MTLTTTYRPTSDRERITTALADGLAVIELGDHLSIFLSPHHLAPAEQVDWLRRLAASAEALAVQIAVVNGEPISGGAA